MDALDLKVTDEFIDTDLCEELCAWANLHAAPSSIMKGDSGETCVRASMRQSCSALVPSSHRLFRALYRRVARHDPTFIIGEIQVLRYTPGGFYKTHYDSHSGKGRRRSLFIYLNHGFIGGYTYFPSIGTLVVPHRGRMVSWRNVAPDGTRVEVSDHCGIYVAHGDKYAVNIWSA